MSVQTKRVVGAKVKLVGLVNGHIVIGDRNSTLLTVARELYAGNRLFDKAAAYCDAMYDEWYILSGSYGVIKPDEMIPKHDRDLRYFNAVERSMWKKRIIADINERGLVGDHIQVFWHSTRPVIELLRGVWPLEQQHAPLLGMGLGEMMGWYVQHGY